MMMAATVMLNCCMNSEVKSVSEQNQKINIFCPFSKSDLLIAKYNVSESAMHHSKRPKGSGTTAKGAMTRENNGP